MINTDHLCMSCMKEVGLLKQCPYCGYLVDSAQAEPYLSVRSVIANRYLVGKLLEHNGDGCTYMAWDLTRREPVTLREFFPDAIAVRTQTDLQMCVMPGCEHTYDECCQSFLELWRKLARLRGHSALIHVTDIVQGNNTAYAVWEHINGITLREFLLLKSKTGYIPWDRARHLLMPVLSAIGTLHSSGILHRGISPVTVLVGQDGKAVLSGFSVWHTRTARGDLTAQLFPGFAAIEQYGFQGQQGTWTDIYAFAGVLYRALIGSDPIEANLRVANDRLMVPGQFAEQLPAYVIHALVNAMQIRPEDRTRTVDQLRAELSASPSAAVAGEAYSQQAVRKTPAAKPRQEKQERDKAVAQQKAKEQEKVRQRKIALRTAGICFGIGLVLLCVLAMTLLRDTLFPSGKGMDGTTTPTASQTELLKVPNFTNDMPYLNVIEDIVHTSRFRFEKQDEYSSTVPAGYIIRQSIQPGEMVPQNTTILLTVSLGVERVVLPDLRGKKFEDEKEEFDRLGFHYTLSIQENDGSYEAGVVKDMSKPANQTYEKGTSLIIQVWGEPPTQENQTGESEESSGGIIE